MTIVAIVMPLANAPNTIYAQGTVDPNVEGTWIVTVTPDGGAAFRALVTFSTGGTMVESSQGDKGGQGVWKRTGGRTFGFTFEQFQFDLNGTFTGTLKVRERDEFDQRFASYSGVATIEGRDPSGKLVFSGCARTQAVRMNVEAPDCR
jgi:hypothetical protein